MYMELKHWRMCYCLMFMEKNEEWSTDARRCGEDEEGEN